MNLTLNNLQNLICHKIQPTNEPTNPVLILEEQQIVCRYLFIIVEINVTQNMITQIYEF